MHKMFIASKSSQRHLCGPLGAINDMIAFSKYIIIWLLNRLGWYSITTKYFLWLDLKKRNVTRKFVLLLILQGSFLLYSSIIETMKYINEHLYLWRMIATEDESFPNFVDIIISIITSPFIYISIFIIGLIDLLIHYPVYKVYHKLKNYLDANEELKGKDIKGLKSMLFGFTYSYDRVYLNREILKLIYPYLKELEKIRIKNVILIFDIYLSNYERHCKIGATRIFTYRVKWNIGYKRQYYINKIINEIKF